jgi:hypothetical protein
MAWLVFFWLLATRATTEQRQMVGKAVIIIAQIAKALSQ